MGDKVIKYSRGSKMRLVYLLVLLFGRKSRLCGLWVGF